MSEDRHLLAAAANWAESGVLDGEQHDLTASASKAEKKAYSLHVTQLSYEASDYDIRDLFISRGCLVSSVRLVRDKDSNMKFKGVAFVDVQDKKSYDLALKLHRITHLGRRVNVRPVLSKEDLGRIAEATKEKVSQIIQATESSHVQQEKKVEKHKDDTTKRKPKKRSRAPKTGMGSRKMTKQERNRKAAILLAKKSRKARHN